MYADQIDLFDELTDEMAGKLIKHVLLYVNDKDPQTDDLFLKIAFAPIKSHLKRDLKKYNDTCSQNSKNAKVRWEKNNADVSDRIRLDAKHADIDNGIDNGIDKKETSTTKKKVVAPKKKKVDENFFPDPDEQKRDFIDQVVHIFKNEYDSKRLNQYMIQKGKDRSAAGKLIRLYKNAHKDHDSDQTLNGMREFFISCIMIKDKWLNDNMTLSIAISKINEINSILKNNERKAKSSGNNAGQHNSGIEQMGQGIINAEQQLPDIEIE